MGAFSGPWKARRSGGGLGSGSSTRKAPRASVTAQGPGEKTTGRRNCPAILPKAIYQHRTTSGTSRAGGPGGAGARILTSYLEVKNSGHLNSGKVFFQVVYNPHLPYCQKTLNPENVRAYQVFNLYFLFWLRFSLKKGKMLIDGL